MGLRCYSGLASATKSDKAQGKSVLATVVESGATSKMEGEATYGARQPNLPTLLPTERGPRYNWQTLRKEKPGR
jgi:hypothetical protein